MNRIVSQISSLGRNEADEEQGVLTSTTIAPEGDNRDGEVGSIKIRSSLQTHLYSLTLIETKKAVLSNVISVVVDLLLPLN